MKKPIARRSVLGLAVCLLAASLAGCGGSGDVRNSDEPVALSQAIAAEGIWFDSSDTPSKDESIGSIISFDGKGNATCYNTNGITYADIKDLSDKEILELAAEHDEQRFEQMVAQRIKRIEKAIENARTNVLPRYQDDLDYMVQMGAPADEIGLAQESIAKIEEEIAGFEQLIEDFKALEYQAPKPFPYQLSIETDDSGNYTAEERLELKKTALDGEGDARLVEQKVGFTFAPGDTGCFPVYDDLYAGFVDDGFWTKVGEDFLAFELDAPGTVGIKVD